MNKERLTQIAEWLEEGAPIRGNVTGFNMECFITEEYNENYQPCGTICCIGGAAVAFFGPPELFQAYAKGDHVREPASYAAGRYLDLSSDEATSLFYASDDFIGGALVWREEREEDLLPDITTDWAARCIRKFIETGDVDWMGTRAA